MIERDRRVSRFDDAKSIPRTSLSGLNDVGRRASLCSADQFCWQSRRQPINVTTARRLTLASCNLYVYACGLRLCVRPCIRFESALFWSTPMLKRYVFYDSTRLVLLPSCLLTRLSGYSLWLSSLWVHHLDRLDISPSIKSMSHIEKFLQDANQARTREYFRILFRTGEANKEQCFYFLFIIFIVLIPLLWRKIKLTFCAQHDKTRRYNINQHRKYTKICNVIC